MIEFVTNGETIKWTFDPKNNKIVVTDNHDIVQATIPFELMYELMYAATIKHGLHDSKIGTIARRAVKLL